MVGKWLFSLLWYWKDWKHHKFLLSFHFHSSGNHLRKGYRIDRNGDAWFIWDFFFLRFIINFDWISIDQNLFIHVHEFDKSLTTILTLHPHKTLSNDEGSEKINIYFLLFLLLIINLVDNNTIHTVCMITVKIRPI